MVKIQEHALVGMRDPEIALGILAREGEEAMLCICCQNSGTEACPHRGHEKAGICAEYSLDERDPPETESRVLAFLTKA